MDKEDIGMNPEDNGEKQNDKEGIETDTDNEEKEAEDSNLEIEGEEKCSTDAHCKKHSRDIEKNIHQGLLSDSGQI